MFSPVGHLRAAPFTSNVSHMTRHLYLPFFILVCLFGSAQATEKIDGTFLRNSKTCGGPGFADGKGGCDLVAEDSLEIVGLSAAEEYKVTFAFHYGYQDYCQYSGTGTKTMSELLLKTEIEGCQLKVKLKGNSARIGDVTNQCAPKLCTNKKVKLDGLTFKRNNG